MTRIDFEILWYNGGPDYAPNRVVCRTFTKHANLDGAIRRACNMLKAHHADTEMAHGFYVRKVRNAQ